VGAILTGGARGRLQRYALRRDPKGAGHMRTLRELDGETEIINDPIDDSGTLEEISDPSE
jgi:hypothetical protein